MSDAKTYRGGSLDEILPRIREELGPDAVITRRREGIVGGLGGFFGKRCLEIEARAPGVTPNGQASLPVVPAQAVLDLYDHGSLSGVGWTEPRVPAPAPAKPASPLPGPAPSSLRRRSEGAGFAGTGARLMDDLLAQAAPFADLLDDAIERSNGHRGHDDDVRGALARAAIPKTVAEALLAEAEGELAVFAPDEPFAEHVRRALARKIRVRHRGRKRRRVVALVGPPGAGKTAAAVSLCAAHARAGTSVCALSLESARRAVDLAVATDSLPVGIELADSPDALELVRSKLRRTDLVVADTPAADPADPDSIARVAELVAALKPSETHLVVPAGAPADAARLLLTGLREHAAVDCLLIADATGVGLALWAGLPISYVAQGERLRPAEPADLARLVLP